MLKTTQFTALNAQLSGLIDTNVSLINASIEGYRQAAFIQCEATRSFISESVNTFKNLCAVKSPSEIAEHVKSFTANSVENTITRSKELMNVFNNSKAVFTDAANSTVKNVQESLAQSIEQISTVNPEFSKKAGESLQNWISSSTQAADAISKASAKVTEFAAKNVQAATTAALNTVK